MFLKSSLSLSSLLLGLGISLSGFAADTPSSSITPYIINGNTVSTADYPYMALLIHNQIAQESKITSFCGATLLNERYVLTAAHCLYTTEPSQFSDLEVVFNVDQIQNDVFDQTNMVAAEAVYYPDDYQNTGNFDNDIAIIELAEPVSSLIVEPNDYVQLTANENYRFDGEVFKVLGYGKTGPDSKSSDTLQAAQVEYAQPELCNQSFESLTLSDKQICVQGKVLNNLQTGVCGGDSGGPLLYEEDGVLHQVGIVSFGPKDCGNTDISVQSVYTKVSGYEGWIAGVLNGTEAAKFDVTEQVNNNNTAESSSSGGSLGSGALMLLCLLGLFRKNFK